VVLQNFNHGPYFGFVADELLANMARYVKEGGALVMSGGDRSFDLAGYGSTPLAEVLPVRLGVAEPQVDEATFRPVLTAAGRAHPLTRIAATPAEAEALWARLPALDGINRTVGATAPAVPLLFGLFASLAWWLRRRGGAR
jgi:hypothetical protein